MQLLFTVLFILGLALQSFVDACSRKSRVLGPITTTTTTTTSSSFPISSIPTTTHKPNLFNCTKSEISKTGCLNEGTCFSMMLGNVRASACKCPKTYGGERCEYIDFDFATSEDRLRIAGIAAGITSCILILLLVMGVIFVYHKRRQTPEPDGDRNTPNEEANVFLTRNGANKDDKK